jgi:hypothetical protein
MNKCKYCSTDISEKTAGGKPRTFCNKSCSRKFYVENNKERLSESGRKSFETLMKNDPGVIKHRGRSTDKKREASKKLHESGHFHDMATKGKETMLKKYGDYFIRELERETKIKNGKWIDYSIFDYDEVKKYNRSIRTLTLKLYGSAGKGYHWDHIVPISKGFEMGISPEIMCSTENIAKMEAKKNISKGNKMTEEGYNIIENWGYKND